VLKNLEWLLEDSVDQARSCSKCGLCLGVCPTYRVTKDVRYSPIGRLEAVAKFKKVKQDVELVERLFSCAMCGACTIVCPMKIETWRAVYTARCLLALMGKAPASLIEVARNSLRIGHPFVKEVEYTMMWVEECKERGVDVEIGRAGASYLFVPSSVENSIQTRPLVNKFVLFSKMGLDITVSPHAIDLGGNTAIDASRPDLALSMLNRVLDEAERLHVDRVVVSECGADFKWVYSVYPTLFEDYYTPKKLVPAFSLFRKFGGRIEGVEPPWYHASCNLSRLIPFYGQILSTVRSLGVKALEPRETGKYTSCCGGGGGLSIVRESPYRDIRRRIARERLRVLKGGEIVVPCVKCMLSLSEAVMLGGGGQRVYTISEYLLRISTPP